MTGNERLRLCEGKVRAGPKSDDSSSRGLAFVTETQRASACLSVNCILTSAMDSLVKGFLRAGIV